MSDQENTLLFNKYQKVIDALLFHISDENCKNCKCTVRDVLRELELEE